jgi:ParB/RepB/Spo0J family partition protein
MNNKTTKISLSDIMPDPKNPRQDFEPKKLAELESSIKVNGILSPLIVEELEDGKYLLVDGERRYRASKNLKLKEVPVTIMESMTDAERLIKRFHLQEQHSNWNNYEKAVAISELAKTSTENVSDLARLLGISTNSANNYILVSSLSKRTAAKASERKLPFNWLVEIASTLKLVDDKGLSSDLEKSFFEKMDSKIITTRDDMRKYRYAIRELGDKVIKKIIEDSNYSAKKATADSGTENILDYEQITHACSELAVPMEKILLRKTRVVPTRIYKRCENVRKLLDKFLSLDHEEDRDSVTGKLRKTVIEK